MSTKDTEEKQSHVRRKLEPCASKQRGPTNPVVAVVGRLVPAGELSQQTGIPTQTIYHMRQRGLIPCYRLGVKQTAIRFVVSEVLQALRRPAQSESTLPTGDA